MPLKSKQGITNQLELNKAEEKISKQKAKQIFDNGDIDKIKVGTFARLYSQANGYICKRSYLDILATGTDPINESGRHN